MTQEEEILILQHWIKSFIKFLLAYLDGFGGVAGDADSTSAAVPSSLRNLN